MSHRPCASSLSIKT